MRTECWGETFRLNEISILESGTRRKQGGEMKPRARKSDSPIEDLPWFKCVALGVSTNFFAQEVNLGSNRKNLTEHLVQAMFACVIGRLYISCRFCDDVLPC